MRQYGSPKIGNNASAPLIVLLAVIVCVLAVAIDIFGHDVIVGECFVAGLLKERRFAIGREPVGWLRIALLGIAEWQS